METGFVQGPPTDIPMVCPKGNTVMSLRALRVPLLWETPRCCGYCLSRRSQGFPSIRLSERGVEPSSAGQLQPAALRAARKIRTSIPRAQGASVHAPPATLLDLPPNLTEQARTRSVCIHCCEYRLCTGRTKKPCRGW